MSGARVEEARGCLERATETDREYADAWALLATLGDVAVPFTDDVELPGPHAINTPRRHDHLGDRQRLSAAISGS
jgi:hypothetical protein